jgi:putative membrane-bound dehydrogenase-like protein
MAHRCGWFSLALALPMLCLGSRLGHGQGYAPDEAVRRMTTPAGFRARLVASEPEVRQPILVQCDDRGRLWVIQYLQYPNPAGLTRVKVDRWSRTVYDSVPFPPPLGPKGADRITILEDTNGDGRADRFRDFVSDLNLCTGLAFGHGGVFVLQVPYLLFYADRDRDDVPDGDPEVLLTGFGMEDAQSLANHLTWGPDGWLYGVNGSTTTCNIRGIEFQQGCWRYHPRTRDFELFCEGGGNTFGLTFDERGELFYSTNGGPFVHAVQGGYFYKNFGKHGPLHNLYAYGYFPELTRDSVPGGPPTGGTVYLGDSFPPEFRGTFIAGSFLGHTCDWWRVLPAATTVRAELGGTLLDSHDTWFGPTDMCLGPDGSMFVCDFHDQRTAHPDPDANWDRSNGRVYKIEADGTRPIEPFDLAKLSSDELADLLTHRNQWFADRARVLLAERRDATVAPRLRAMALNTNPPRQQGSADEDASLEGLWGLNAVAELDDATAGELLHSEFASVRAWTVRLLCDRRQLSKAIASQVVVLAASEPEATVRCQLAASARRLPAADGLPIIAAILDRGLDDDDPRIPLLCWWAVESWSASDAPLLLAHFARPAAWDVPSNQKQIVNLVRRYAAAGNAAGYDACLRLIEAKPASDRAGVHLALSQGLAERSTGLGQVESGGLFEQFATATTDQHAATTYEPLSAGLLNYIDRQWRGDADDPFWTAVAVRSGSDDAYAELLTSIANHTLDDASRTERLGILAEQGREDCVPAVLPLVDASQCEAVQSAALRVLGRFADPAIAARLLAEYPRMSAALRTQARDVLLSRPASTRAFLHAVDAGTIDAKDTPVEQLRRVALHQDDELNALVRRHWGNIQPGTPEEKLATMRRFNNDLRAGSGDAEAGHALYKKHCGTCHELFGEGNKIGPELTKANRADRDALLANIVDPSAVVRKEYASYTVLTTDGRIVTGLLAEQDAAAVTLLDAKNVRSRIARTDVESLEESAVSLMPEKILEQLSPQELRDLFAHLQRQR